MILKADVDREAASGTKPEPLRTVAVPVSLPRERAVKSDTLHLLFGSGPFAYRLLRWFQRSRR